MSDFEFKKDGVHVAPVWEACTDDFWKGVTVYGWAGSLSGKGREILQTGYWDLDFPGTHYEYFKIDKVAGLEIGTHGSWRHGYV